MEIKYLFPTFLAEEHILVDNEKIERYCYQRKDSEPSAGMTNYKGWHSEHFDPWIPELNDLTTIVQQKLDEVCEHIDFGTRASVNNCFININGQGAYHAIHDHPGSFLSAVYYVNANKFRGDLILHNSDRMLSWHQNSSKITKYNALNSSTWAVPGDTGKLLIFPAWLKHEVRPNLTVDDRISIVYNCHMLG